MFGFNSPSVCRVTEGSIENDENLKILNAFNNITSLVLTTVKFERMPKNIFTLYSNLTVFYVSYNNLKELSADDFNNANNVKDMSFFRNELTSIPPKVFLGCTSLTKLTIATNPISNIDEDAFYGLNILSSLSINDLPLEKFYSSTFKNLPSLQSLKMENCSLKAITNDFFTNNPKLTSVGFFMNLIEYIQEGTFEKLPNINSVELTKNNLVTFSTSNIPNVVLHSNLLRHIHVGSKTISLAAEENFIANITCDENLSTRFLYLGNNSISRLRCIRKMTSLMILHVHFNKFGRINRNIFLNLRNVTRLKISENPKLKLSSKMLTSMTRLNSLELDGFVNGFRNLNTTFLNLRAITLNVKMWPCARINRVATVLNSQKIYMFFLNERSELNEFVCNITSSQANQAMY